MKRLIVFALAVAVAATLVAIQPPQVYAGADPFVGEIAWVPYNFAPRNWAFCNGQLMSIVQNTALFSLLGTTYGGDGRTTFALPNVQSRVMIHAGPGPGLTPRSLGETGGEENHTSTTNEMPGHTHQARASSAEATETSPFGNVSASKARVPLYDPGPANASMNGTAIGVTGGSQPHNNMPPYTVLNCIISLYGIYPSRN